MGVDQRARPLMRHTVELLRKIDQRRGDFASCNYTGMPELLRQPFMQDVTLSEADIQSAFMARRIEQMMRLPMSSTDGQALNQIGEAVERWKQKTSYINASPRITEERTKGFKVREINAEVVGSFENFGLTGITKRKSDGYLTWTGLFESELSQFEIIFDVRTKYAGSMRFSIKIEDRQTIYDLSNWEAFCDLIFAVLGISTRPCFVYLDNRDDTLSSLKNYLKFLGLVIEDMKGWSS